MADNISQIKERLSVVDLISSYIKVQKSGMNFKARCPFHNEKTPSFYISPERQIWHCFGCSKGGDIFGFVKEIEGVEFGEALKILAQRAGVKLESFDPGVKDSKSVLYDICETATRFFEKQLHHSPVGKIASAYLTDRGLVKNTIQEFRLGFAPDGWHNLSHFLRDCGYKDNDIIDAGLALKREDGSDSYDRFRSRIIFPIADVNDRIVGFTGRVFEAVPTRIAVGIPPSDFDHAQWLDKDRNVGAKYINTPQTLIYDKSRVLYGFNKAKLETRRADRCLLVEGNMDAIMSYQAGVKNVAATSGTALTPSHLQLLQRYTSNLDFCFDTDQAGLAATRRGIGLALSQNLNIKIVHFNDPECKDPADYVKKFGRKWFEEVQKSKPVIEFYFDKLKSELDLSSVDGKKTIIVNLGPLIRRLVSNVEQAHWVSKLAIVLKTKEEAVKADLLSAKDDLDSYQNYKTDSRKIAENLPGSLPDNIFEEAFLAVIIKKPSLFTKDLADIKTTFSSSFVGSVISRLTDSDIENFKFFEFISVFDEETKMKLDFAYLKSQELLKDFTDKELVEEFNNIKSKLDRKIIAVQLTDLEFDIKLAEAGDDKNKLMLAMAKFNELSKKLSKIN